MENAPKSKRRKYAGVFSDNVVREFFLNVAGENALTVATEITEPMSDESLSRVCKLKVSEVRAVLNKLHYEGIADYERTRDKESGWYSYTWRLDLEKVPHILEEKKNKEMKEAQEKLAIEKTVDFYSCRKCKRGKQRLTFEQASEQVFKCVNCGSVLLLHDNTKEVKLLEKKVKGFGELF